MFTRLGYILTGLRIGKLNSYCPTHIMVKAGLQLLLLPRISVFYLFWCKTSFKVQREPEWTCFT